MQFPALAGFLSGYLHQDWDVEYDSDLDAAIEFGRNGSVESVIKTLGEGWVLLATSSEDELTEWLARAGCAYLPDPGMTSSQWLRRLLDLAAATVGERSDIH